MLESVLKVCIRGLCNQVKVGGNAKVLACEETLLFKAGLKLMPNQDGYVRYVEDRGGQRYQVKEMVA